MLASPYAPGSSPGYLAGRGRELDDIRNRLARMSALGRSGGPLLAFYGSRGLGKTSLLREAQRDARRAGYLTVWVTGRDDVDMAPDLARSLTEEVRRESFGERAKGLLHKLDKVQVELGVPGAKVGVEMAGPTAALNTAAIESTLEDAGRFARHHDRGGLAVFVDEFQEARLGDRRSLLIALQHFDGAPDGCPVAVVAAGLPSMLGAVPEAATFGERTKFVEVGLLSDVAVAEALRFPAQELGVSWSDDAIFEAVTASHGYPHRAQLIGEGSWEAARPDVGGRIEVGHVRQGLYAADQQMATLFRSRVAKATGPQRRFLAAMADLGDGPVARADLAARLETSTTSISQVRQELIDRGLIEPAGYGELRFTIPGFAGFLRREARRETGQAPPALDAPSPIRSLPQRPGADPGPDSST
ncbi:AAA family ATPase [Nocardioides lijunqiniae]|uniref:AAA family ATPase n=1 Tax=Nocardioides lijunqiniae TaxID=2760832 RepID=UPI001877C83A|nr:ATP-binding protein [Nocardioides lijunqiniae]